MRGLWLACGSIVLSAAPGCGLREPAPVEPPVSGSSPGAVTSGEGGVPADADDIGEVIEAVDRTCRERTVYMLGPEKARRLAELVREKKPRLVVECGTALGYSGLWIARALKEQGSGRLITLEIDAQRAREAQENFRRGGVDDIVEVRVGDARQLVREIREEVDFLFLDCGFGSYHPCFTGIEERLAGGALLVADNVGVGAAGMADYLELVRSRFESRTEWFDIDLPWGRRDALEITVYRP